jgi:hypothetical protein
MSGFVFVDSFEPDEDFDPKPDLYIPFAPAGPLFAPTTPAVPAAPTTSSVPVYTSEIGALTFTVIGVNLGGRLSYQVYAVEASSWQLVGLFGLFVDALAEINTWRKFIAGGGSLRAWIDAHPEGVEVTR